IVVSVCRAQPLSVEGVDPDGVYQVEIEGEPARHLIPRVVRTIQALLSKRSDAAVASGLRAQTPGITRFLDLSITGEQDRFVERTVRITRLPAEETAAARAAIRATIPPRTGRVICATPPAAGAPTLPWPRPTHHAPLPTPPGRA